MMDAFTRALAFTLPSEGGYVDNPNDTGGATDKGVTQAVYNVWRSTQGFPTRPVEQIEDAEVQNIYQHLYWNPAHCAELGDTLSIAHFDFAVNHGVFGAAKILQQAAGVFADGIIGPATLAAVSATTGITAKYLDLRADFYRQLAADEAHDAAFLDGWLDRVALLRAYLGLPEPLSA